MCNEQTNLDGHMGQQVNMDSSQLLLIFPEEIWEQVLKEFKFAMDLEACSNASTFFRDRLVNQRKYYLFPKIIQHIAPMMEPVPSHKTLSWHQRKSRGLLKSLANIRLTCSSWNQAFVNFCQLSGPSRFQMQRESKEKSSIFKFVDQVKCIFEIGGSQPDQFVGHFEESHFLSSTHPPKKNPFPGRSVLFRMLNLERVPTPRMQNYLTGIEAMLLKYGHEIWYCEIQLEDERPFIADFYFQLRAWLSLMSNLKALGILYLNQPYTKLGPLNLFDLEDVITAHPLPKLKHLKMLTSGTLPSPIFNQLVKRSQNFISNLEINRRQSNRGCYDALYYVPLPSLKSLSMHCDSVDDLEKLEMYAGNWQLESFHFFYSDKNPFIPWSRLFAMIQKHWSGSLTDLAIHLPTPNRVSELNQIVEETKSMKIYLPNVKRLYLNLDIPCSLDFILVPMKDSLERLKISSGYCERSLERKSFWHQTLANEQTIQMVGFEHCLYESNIWKMMRKLNVVKMRFFDGEGKFQKFVYKQEEVCL